MTTLVVGASGATGRLLVQQLLQAGERVRVVVRPHSQLPAQLESHPQLEITRANVLELSDAELQGLVAGCQAVASCLGHNLSFKGIYGQPRRLVRDATMRLCAAIQSLDHDAPIKYVLMNSTGNRNRDIPERVSVAEHLVVALIRILVPPHADNEQAADYLRRQCKDSDSIEWVVVRPDTLQDADVVTDYQLHPSPIRSAIFDAGVTSRINVGDFMMRLITEQDLWAQWKGKMPVIYNASQASSQQ